MIPTTRTFKNEDVNTVYKQDNKGSSPIHKTCSDDSLIRRTMSGKFRVGLVNKPYYNEFVRQSMELDQLTDRDLKHSIETVTRKKEPDSIDEIVDNLTSENRDSQDSHYCRLPSKNGVEHSTSSITCETPNTKVQNATDMYRAMAILEKMTQQKNMSSWSRDQESMLNIWAEKAADYKTMHEMASNYYRFMNDLLAYPIILVSSVLGMGGFAIIKTKQEHQNDFDIIMAYVIAACNLLVAFLSSLQKMKKYSENAQLHHAAAIEYIKFYREIKMELIIDRGHRTYALDFCRDAKLQYDKLVSESPTIPSSIENKFNNSLSKNLHNISITRNNPIIGSQYI